MEAYNYCKCDYYEPLYFCLTPIAKYSDLSFQLKIMFQLVKPSSVFSNSKFVEANKIKPIALQIDMCSACLLVWMNMEVHVKEEFLDKKLYYSCTMHISNDNYVRTSDQKGLLPGITELTCWCSEWNHHQIISLVEFQNQTVIIFSISSVTHPYQQSTKQVVGEAKLAVKQIYDTVSFSFKLPVESVMVMRCRLLGRSERRLASYLFLFDPFSRRAEM